MLPQWQPPICSMLFVSTLSSHRVIGSPSSRAIAQWPPLSVPPGNTRHVRQDRNFSPAVILSIIFRSAWSPSPTRSSAAVGVAATLARLSASLAVLNSEADVAADRAAVGAGEFGARGAVDENRLADHRRVKPAVRRDRARQRFPDRRRRAHRKGRLRHLRPAKGASRRG